MSAFRHPHNTKVRSLEEELAEMGLNPDRVLSEIDRNTAMLEGGPIPLDLAGLREGSDDIPRSLSQYGSTLLDEKKCKGNGKDDDDDDDEDDDEDEDEGEENGNGKSKNGNGKSKNGNGADSEGMGESVIVEKQWIQQAIKDPGRVREYLGVKEGEKIPAAKLNTAIEKLKAVENKSDEQKSLLSALVLAKRLKSGVGEEISESAADVFIEEDVISDALYLISEGWELTEIFKVIKKARGAAARLAKRMRHRAYLMQRGAKKLAAKIFRRRFKRKIKRAMKRKVAKYGQKGIERLHKMGRRIMQVVGGKKKKEWSDTLANIAEELDRDTAPVTEDTDALDEAMEHESIAVEVLVNAATTAMYLGEIFDAMGDEAGQALLDLSEKAVDIADAVEANGGEPTEEHEKHIETVLEAVIKALGQHEAIGSPSLGEAIGIVMVAEGLGTWEELVEYTVPSPMELQQKIAGKKMGATVMPDPTVAGKYLKAINMAMQKMDPTQAMKAAEAVVKKHKVVDVKGLPVPRVESMTDVLRVMFYLSQITGLKAPAWMYRGKAKPWFVTSDEDEDQTGKAKPDEKLATALKALGAPAGVLKALAAA